MDIAEPPAWSAGAQAFLAAVLDCVAEPVWVVDHEGAIVFANPAAVRVLGYEHAAQLTGLPSHETIHSKHPDGSANPVETCPMLAPRMTGATIHCEEDWFVRRDGSMFPVGYTSAPIEGPAGRGAVVAFRDLTERRAAEQAARERDVAEARAAEARAAQRRIVEAHDAARRQVTRDLHDGAQQQLVAAVIDLQSARGTWVSDPDRARELLGQGIGSLQAGIAALRELAAGLHPAILTTRGLGAALDALAQRLPLPVVLDDRSGGRLPVNVEATAYFVAAEALTNAVKHARAARLDVLLAREGRLLVVEVADDGSGAAPADLCSGSGLAGMADRVAAVDGTLEIVRTEGVGTKVRIILPAGPSD
jgi:PAS domain S-box-containing protein